MQEQAYIAVVVTHDEFHEDGRTIERVRCQNANAALGVLVAHGLTTIETRDEQTGETITRHISFAKGDGSGDYGYIQPARTSGDR